MPDTGRDSKVMGNAPSVAAARARDEGTADDAAADVPAAACTAVVARHGLVAPMVRSVAARAAVDLMTDV
ncbi:hypothetical protein TBR22_A36590 [Luteitalea sp. TBR-22]|nr:hypothetical protein TBR22_A36590 [Luteitalea sp. TBR-22]